MSLKLPWKKTQGCSVHGQQCGRECRGWRESAVAEILGFKLEVWLTSEKDPADRRYHWNIPVGFGSFNDKLETAQEAAECAIAQHFANNHALRALLGEADRWISVGVRLPVPYEDVWVSQYERVHNYDYTRSADTQRSIRARYNESRGEWMANGEVIHGVTHWMPEPGPPPLPTDRA